MEKRTTRRESFAMQMATNTPSKVMAALVAYDESSESRESVISRMMAVTGWSRTIADCYYKSFKADGVNAWRKEVMTWMRQAMWGKC